VSKLSTLKLREMKQRTDTNIETNGLGSRAGLYSGIAICGDRVVVGDESCTVAEPKRSKGDEDDEGKCVTQDPLSLISFVRFENVCKMLTSPTPPRTISMPPENIYQPMLAAPFPPAPRHPMSVQLSGVSDSRKPTRALYGLATAIASVDQGYIQWCWVTKGLS
jgi:hypothetical protein